MSDFTTATLPRPPHSYIRMVGPGIIMMALAQGSGELIWWPYLIGTYGLGLLFLLLPAALLQWPVNYEVGRYSLLSGESIFRGFSRWNRFFGFTLWVMFTLCFLWFGAYATAGGTALAELTGFPDSWGPEGRSLFWANVTIVIFVFAIFASHGAYKVIERAMRFVALVTFVALVAAAFFQPQVMSRASEFWPATIIPGEMARPWNSADARILVTGLLFAGLGGFWNLLYSNWVIRKPFGMAQITNESDASEFRSAVFCDESAESRENYPKWRRVLLLDSGVGIVGNLITTLLLCWLAFAYLTPSGEVPGGWKLTTVQAVFFESAWGHLGRVLFLGIAALFLADTWLTTVDAVARVHGDYIAKWFPGVAAMGERALYYLVVAALTVVTWITMWLEAPGVLITVTGVLNAAAMVICAGALLFLNSSFLKRTVPGWALPRVFSRLFLVLAFLGYAVLLVWYLSVSLF